MKEKQRTSEENRKEFHFGIWCARSRFLWNFHGTQHTQTHSQRLICGVWPDAQSQRNNTSCCSFLFTTCLTSVWQSLCKWKQITICRYSSYVMQWNRTEYEYWIYKKKRTKYRLNTVHTTQYCRMFTGTTDTAKLACLRPTRPGGGDNIDVMCGCDVYRFNILQFLSIFFSFRFNKYSRWQR